MTSQSGPPISTRFCWYPLNGFRHLSQAVEFESSRLGMSHSAANLFLASCLQAVSQLEMGRARRGRDFRQIALARSEVLFELRFSFRADFENFARLYFTQTSEPMVAIGLLIRIKSLDGDRGQIRERQNSDISEVLQLLLVVKAEKSYRCLQEGAL